MNDNFERRAGWIWVNEEKSKNCGNLYVYFRKIFEIKKIPEKLNIWVSSDGKYNLYINGYLIGRGPTRSLPWRQYADKYNISKYLKEGFNSILSVVHTYEKATSWYMPPVGEHAERFGTGGFFLQGSFINDDKEFVIDTNESWKYKISDSWEADTDFGPTGYREIVKINDEISDWEDVDFNESSWGKAVVLIDKGIFGSNPIEPFPLLIESPISGVKETIIEPIDIKYTGRTISSNVSPSIKNIGKYKIKFSGNKSLGSKLMTKTGHGEVFTIDFGKTVIGRICIEVDSYGENGFMDYSYSEWVSKEGNILLTDELEGIHNIIPGNRIYLKKGKNFYESFEKQGFRYMQIVFFNFDKGFKVRALDLRESHYPVNFKGLFKSDNKKFNKIWDISRSTLLTCMQDSYIDCPSREQRNWINDQYIQQLVNYSVFGDYKLARKNLVDAYYSQYENGLIPGAVYSDLSVDRTLNIVDGSLYWILSVWNYYLYSGDRSLIEEVFPGMLKIINWFANYLNGKNLIENIPHWIWLDWTMIEKEGINATINALFSRSLEAVADCCAEIDFKKKGQELLNLKREIDDSLNNLFWDEKRGIYIDSLGSNTDCSTVSQQTNAFMISFNIAPRQRWGRILEHILDPERVKLTYMAEELNYLSRTDISKFNRSTDIVLAQPFLMHFINHAIYKTGKINLVLRNIEDHWGKMLEKGATSWWESWAPDHRFHSLCHAYSTSPGFDLSTYILNIFPLRPGFKEFVLSPNLDLYKSYSIKYPIPDGEVEIDFNRENKDFNLVLKVPKNTICNFKIDKKCLSNLIVNNEKSDERSFKLNPGSYVIEGEYLKK